MRSTLEWNRILGYEDRTSAETFEQLRVPDTAESRVRFCRGCERIIDAEVERRVEPAIADFARVYSFDRLR